MISCRKWIGLFKIVGLLFLATTTPTNAGTLVFDQVETAGICGYRSMWDTPVMTAADGVRNVIDKEITDRGGQAPFMPKVRIVKPETDEAEDTSPTYQPAALAFDAIHRSLLVRFPGAAEKIAEQVNRGQRITKVELVLPYIDEELWPEGSTGGVLPEDGGGYVYRMNWGIDKMYRKVRPTWHAIAWALRKPWIADSEIGPTYNAYIGGVGYWNRFGAQDTESDRIDERFGPTPVNYENPKGSMDVTASLTHERFGATLAERLRRLADCGFLIRKWETYDHRFYVSAYEWATCTGPRAIVIDTPKLIVTLESDREAPRATNLPPAADVHKLAEQLAGRGGRPTAVMPSANQLKRIATDFEAKKPSWMPEWQWQRTQELLEAEIGQGTSSDPFWYQFVPKHEMNRCRTRYRDEEAGEWKYTEPDPAKVYEKWVDSMLCKPYRGWHGFEAATVFLPWFIYKDAMPEPCRQWYIEYWQAWLMPDRETAPLDRQTDHTYVDGPLIHPMADDPRVGSDKSQVPDPAAGRYDSYYAATGDWRGNKSFYRGGFNYCISTTNFNNTASMGALLGGSIIDSPRAIADGRYGQMNYPLKLWTWYDGSTQEDIDHYYFAYTLTAQKMIADFGPEHLDRMIGRSMLTKSINLITDAYHPGLHRMIAGSSRTATEHLLVTQDGLYHALHALSPRGVLRDLDNPQIAHDLPVIGHDVRPAHIARQTVVGPWAPDWTSHLIDDKPLPFRVKSSYKQWGGHDAFPLTRTHYLGHHYGLYSISGQNGNIPIMAQWRRSSGEVRRMQEIGTMLVRFGINTTRLVNDAGGWIAPRGNQATVQKDGKILVATSPYEYGKWINEKNEIQSIQSTIALYNFQDPAPTWEIYVDGRRIDSLPFKARASQRITIRDGVSYIGIIPLPATNLGRRDEIVLRQGEPQTYYNQYTVTAALCIDNVNLQSDKPLEKNADWERIDKAYGGFVIEMADATEYRTLADFQRHISQTKLTTKYDAAQSVHEVSYTSGDDVLELGAKTTYSDGQTLDQLFTKRLINGQSPDLPEGIDRDTTLAQQGTTGRLEKNGAILRSRPGRMTFLQTEPKSGTFAAYNVLVEPNPMIFELPGGIEIASDGDLGIASIVACPRDRKIWIDHAMTPEIEASHGSAAAILVFGMQGNLQVQLNGKPARGMKTVEVDGRRATLIPLHERGIGTRYLRFREEIEAADQAAEMEDETPTETAE